MPLVIPALALALAGGATAPTAAASGDEWGLNGTYQATSNGDWAKTNDIYHNEATCGAGGRSPPRAAPRWNAPAG